ncbi:Neurogenic differentiation factor [Fasciola gigantica]|uniref:Neurogenic differentiation factor n=1 Tax=Fasciola gigantica TaxID=46835 RepID=A0A504YKH8_FASGI|nr:Neurogenic differentiation factor [Fasciola gigantica]
MDYLLEPRLVRDTQLPTLNYPMSSYSRSLLYTQTEIQAFSMGHDIMDVESQNGSQNGLANAQSSGLQNETDFTGTGRFSRMDTESRVTSEPVKYKARRGKTIDAADARQNDVSINQTDGNTRGNSTSLTEPEAKQPKKRGPKKKPLTKEREVRLKNRRVRANARERSRMHGLNHALELLRRHVPTFSESQRLSKIETLRLAKNYIRSLTDLLTRSEPPSHLELAYILTEGLSQNTTNLIATTLQVSPRALIQLQRQNSTDEMKDTRMTWSPCPSLSPSASSSTSRLTKNPSRIPAYTEQFSGASVPQNSSSVDSVSHIHTNSTEDLSVLDTDRMHYNTPYEQTRSSSSMNYNLSTYFSPTPSSTSVIPDTLEHKLYSVSYLHANPAPESNLPVSRSSVIPSNFITNNTGSITNPYGIGSNTFLSSTNAIQSSALNPTSFMNGTIHTGYLPDFAYDGSNSYAYLESFMDPTSGYLPGI